MSIYNGIPISEYRLPVTYILYSLLFAVGLIALLVWIRLVFADRDKKQAARLKELRSKAPSDPVAAKRLAKEERRLKRHKKKKREDFIYNTLVFSIAAVAMALMLTFGIIPAVTDHIVKDYVVYTGEIKVSKYIRRSSITLEDGTVIYGSTDLTSEDTFGTVVYAKRSKTALGGQK